jgi:hypothetical protein
MAVQVAPKKDALQRFAQKKAWKASSDFSSCLPMEISKAFFADTRRRLWEWLSK